MNKNLKKETNNQPVATTIMREEATPYLVIATKGCQYGNSHHSWFPGLTACW